MPHMADGQQPIRVLWVTKGLGPGGAERLLVSFARKTDRRRFEIRAAYLLPWKAHLVGELAALGVSAECLDGRLEADLRWLRRLRALVREARIDVVHVHSPLVAAFARPALWALPRRDRPALMGTEHNVWSSHHPLMRSANRLTLPLRLASRTEVVIHGVDVEAIAARRSERAAARTELGLGNDELVVVTVANLRAQKDYPTMLQAARRLGDAGEPVRF